MQHPYQCIAAVAPTDQSASGGSYMLAACGPRLRSVSLTEGRMLSEWQAESSATNVTNDNEGNGESERPKKKQKTAPQVKPTNIKLTISPDQQHAVVVTDDKYVRVFTVADGMVAELSQRCMPKRPCAVQVLPDNATIVCADKFGDVYSLPLLPDTAQEADIEAGALREEAPSAKDEKPTFKPSATNLTVHTQRNRKALEAQMQQKAFTAKKEPLKFQHKLLLGHVSMLTDAVCATRNIDGQDRGYIITADRDEHIRISRGPPQAHIIEGYCLGHKEFVSRLCLIPGTDFLVSGGGDDELFVWEWPAFTLRRTIPLYDASMSFRLPPMQELNRKDGQKQVDAPSTPRKNTAVSGLWIAPYLSGNDKQETALLVAIERQPALYIIPTNRLHLKTGREFGLTMVDLQNPPLDVACIRDSVIVSFDTRDDGRPQFQAYNLQYEEGHQEAWRVGCARDEEMEAKLKCLDDRIEQGDADATALDELLYGVANLRKRRGWGAPAEEGGDEQESEIAVEDAAED